MNIQNSFFGIALLATASMAQVPGTVLFQGTMSKSGTPLTGSHEVVINLCTSSVVDADDCQEIYVNDNVAFTKGYYSVLLGTDIPLPTFDKQYYLQVSVDGSTPDARIELSSTTSALNALHADTAKVALKAKAATLADSTKGGAARSALAALATISTKTLGFESAKDTAFLTDGTIKLDDTVTFISRNNSTANSGFNTIYMSSKADAATMGLYTSKYTSTSTRSSGVSLTENEAQLYTNFGSQGGGGSRSIIVGQQNVTINADTVVASKGTNYADGTTVLKTDAIQLVQPQPTGYMGGANMPDCVTSLAGMIMFQAGTQGGPQNVYICRYIGAGTGDRYIWTSMIGEGALGF